MATVVETPMTFGERAGDTLIAISIATLAEAPGTIAQRARADVVVRFVRDDGREGRSDGIRVAIAPEGSPVPPDAAVVIQGVDQTDINGFLAVALAIWNSAVAEAERDLTP